MEKLRQLGEARVGALVVKYSTPAIAGMVIYGLNRIVGNIFVGKILGEEALAGFTVANSIVMIQLAVIMLVGTGSSALVSILLGKGERERASRALGGAVTIGLVLGIALMAAFETFATPILLAFGARDGSLSYALSFSRVYVPGSVFAIWNTTFNGAIRAEGQPGKALVTNVISFAINTALMPVFLFAIPLGIAGIAVANVLTQAILALWLGAHFTGKRTVMPLRMASLKVDRELARRTLAIGVAPFFMQFLGASLSLVTNNVVRSLAGDLGLAVAGAVFSVYFLFLMPLQGTATGIQPIIGYNFGAGKRDRVRRTVVASLAFTFAICAVETALAFAFRSRLGALFTRGDSALVVLSATGLGFAMAAFPVACVQFVASSYFLATGKSARALAVNLFRSVGVLIPIALLPPWLGLNGLFLAYPIMDVVVAALCVILMRDAFVRRSTRSGDGIAATAERLAAGE